VNGISFSRMRHRLCLANQRTFMGWRLSGLCWQVYRLSGPIICRPFFHRSIEHQSTGRTRIFCWHGIHVSSAKDRCINSGKKGLTTLHGVLIWWDAGVHSTWVMVSYPLVYPPHYSRGFWVGEISPYDNDLLLTSYTTQKEYPPTYKRKGSHGSGLDCAFCKMR